MTGMMRLLILAAAFGLAASQAWAACDYHQTTASKVDTTKVASVSKEDTQKMSTPAPQPSTVVIQEDKTAPVEAE
jgi:hypothetical protein